MQEAARISFSLKPGISEESIEAATHNSAQFGRNK